MTINNYKVININDIFESSFFDKVMFDIENFSSKNNDDVEIFLRKNAVNFCKLKQGVTYLVYNQNLELSGYFTLTLKIMEFSIERLSKKTLKILERLGQKDDNKIKVPGVLLAQWSKNFSLQNLIHGTELMNLVEIVFENIQYLVGGSFCFLECEAEKTKLLERYGELGYTPVSKRISTTGKPLIQLIKKI